MKHLQSKHKSSVLKQKGKKRYTSRGSKDGKVKKTGSELKNCTERTVWSIQEWENLHHTPVFCRTIV